MKSGERLSDSAADAILSMITIEKKYKPGDKLPNENELSEELGVSRITLREAIRILVAGNVVEVKRGKGTFVRQDFAEQPLTELTPVLSAKVGVDDLFEMRLIFEPEAAYYATIRATDSELNRILAIGEKIEEMIREGQDRTQEEMAFHRSIAKATHNEFMNKLMPVLQESVSKGVFLYEKEHLPVEDVIADHRMIMEFMKNRNAEGARNAMKIHILHAIQELDIKSR